MPTGFWKPISEESIGMLRLRMTNTGQRAGAQWSEASKEFDKSRVRAAQIESGMDAAWAE